MNDHYDVIVIGSGAGGGTMFQALGATGKRVLLLERGDFLHPREAELEPRRRVGRASATATPARGLDRTASPSHRSSTSTSVATPRSTAPCCSACANATSAPCSTTAGSSPAWPLTYDDFEPWYTRAEHLYHVHGKHGERPPRPAGVERLPVPGRSATNRASQQLWDDLSGAGPAPVPAADGHPARRVSPEHLTVHPLRHLRRLPVPGQGKADARRSASSRHCDLSQRDAAHQRPGHARWRPIRRAHASTASSSIASAASRSTPPTSSCCPPARSTARRCCCNRRTTHHPTRARQLVRRRRPPPDVAPQLVADRLLQDPNPTLFQKTLGINDLYYGDGRVAVSRSAACRCTARAMPSGRVRRPDDARRTGPPRGRLLDHHRGPAPARQPGHCRARRTPPAVVTPHQHRGPPPPHRQVEGPAGRRCSATSEYIENRPLLGRPARHLRGGRIRTARSGSAPTRPHQRSTSTARCTTRQPLRRRLEVLLLRVGRQPDPDHHRQRSAGRRPPRRTARRRRRAGRPAAAGHGHVSRRVRSPARRSQTP